MPTRVLVGLAPQRVCMVPKSVNIILMLLRFTVGKISLYSQDAGVLVSEGSTARGSSLPNAATEQFCLVLGLLSRNCHFCNRQFGLSVDFYLSSDDIVVVDHGHGLIT